MKGKEEDEENKIRKFAYREQTDNQTNREQTKSNSKTEATLILCGSSGERANFVQFLINVQEIVKQISLKLPKNKSIPRMNLL